MAPEHTYTGVFQGANGMVGGWIQWGLGSRVGVGPCGPSTCGAEVDEVAGQCRARAAHGGGGQRSPGQGQAVQCCIPFDVFMGVLCCVQLNVCGSGSGLESLDL